MWLCPAECGLSSRPARLWRGPRSADLTGAERGAPDGLKVDAAGNVYCGGAGGIYILDPQGKKLARIVHGQPATTNIGFGGDDLKTLFFISRTHLGSVNIKIAGIPAPPPKRI
jgi:gluconolactonase